MIAVIRTSLMLALLLASSCSYYLSEPRVPKTDLRATLGGAYEVPPTQSRGSGYFEAVYRPSTKVLEYRLNLVGLSGPITMGSLQGPAAPDENAQPVAPTLHQTCSARLCGERCGRVHSTRLGLRTCRSSPNRY